MVVRGQGQSDALSWTYRSSMESHDHAMFTGINASLYTQLGGIAPTGPGYETLTIAPKVPAGLHHVSASIETARGKVVSSWTKDRHTFELDVTIPVNATATVSVPLFGHGENSVTADRTPLPHVEGDTAVYAVGSGHWHFTTHL